MTAWTCALALDSRRRIVAGSEAALADAIRRGADLRIATAFHHNEHIDVASDSPELVQEVAEFGVTYLLRDAWTAGVMSLRQPIELPTGFGPRPSMSFFLYNQNGEQAIARPYLDGPPAAGRRGPAPIDAPPNMPKYHATNSWDGDTNAPSTNFVYDFEHFEFFVHDCWREVLSHDERGTVLRGSVPALADAFASGCEVKVAVRGVCASLADDPDAVIEHELFVQAGSCYYYTEQQLFMVGTHPVVRVRPAVPMSYDSEGWDFGWLMLRTDGHAVYRRCDPYTLAFNDVSGHYAVRWFVR